MVVKDIQWVVMNPDDFMKEKAPEEPLWKPSVLVLLVGIVNTVSSVLLAQRLGNASQAGQVASGIASVLGAVLGLISTFALWLLSAVLIFGIVWYLSDTEPSFRDLFRDIGWGYIPVLLASLLNSIAYVYILNRTSDSLPSEELQVIIESSTVLQVVSVIGISLTIWKGFIWMFAIRRRSGLRIRTAAVIAFLVPVVEIVFSLWSLI
ncbi:YIP1 family protein [Haloarcula sediminis]|uniref:YIP1 family protein n=1 Tax=Haloarcula sediminis TaxID=3111777 RepID=UPI002D79C7EA|nr:YIP1 family protein [Haloarcula sp. CK38]